jgi:hypothetical protein
MFIYQTVNTTYEKLRGPYREVTRLTDVIFSQPGKPGKLILRVCRNRPPV